MSNAIGPETLQKIRALYAEDPDARRFFDAAALRHRDAKNTSIETFIRELAISRNSAVSLARSMQAVGCGAFIAGRRGAKSRFEWLYSLSDLGKVANGGLDSIDQIVSAPFSETEDDGVVSAQSYEPPLTIQEAKRRLAEALGVKSDQIEIQIRA